MTARTTIQLRRGTAAQWTAANPTLAAGEFGVETDTGKRKVGDGATAWASLPYSVLSTDSRLTDSRTPTAHATSHKSGGSDPIKLNELAAPTAAVALNSQKITGMANGAASGDAATYEQTAAGILTTAGDIITRGASAPGRKAVGANGQLLTVDTSQADKLAYVDGPWHVSVPLTTPPSSKVGTWVYATNNSYVNNYTVTRSSPVVNDEINWKVWLPAGTWTLQVTYQKSNASGIATIQLGGSTIATVDSYAAGTTYNNLSTTTGISVTATGVYTLRFLIASKNASSGGYYWQMGSVDFTRTA